MADTVTCPAEGCEFSGLRSSVGSHWFSLADGDHPGNQTECFTRLDSGSNPEDSDSPPDEPESEPEPKPATSDDGENPLLDGPESAPVDRRGSGGSSDSAGDEPAADPGGPGCCENPALRALPAGKRFTTADGRRARTNEGDRVCENCQAVVAADGEVVR